MGKLTRRYLLLFIIPALAVTAFVWLSYFNNNSGQPTANDGLIEEVDEYIPPSPSTGNSSFITASTPTTTDPNLEVQLVYKGLQFPTQMAFLGPNDILVLQKNDGKVQRITDCALQPEPLLDLPVANLVERGLLGIAISDEQKDGQKYVFLFFTLAQEKDGDDEEGNLPLGHKIYRYEFVDGKLVNPKPLYSLSASRGASHNGGLMTIGPDNNLYFTIGDIAASKTRAQNLENGTAADGTSTILRITFEGESAGPILGNGEPISKFYAYGVRNSFGLDFDPLTGKLWDTENGPDYGDEINIVEPGFNSGWLQIMGFSDKKNFSADDILVECLYCDRLTGFFDRWINRIFFGIQDGEYSDPEFVWQIPVGVTAIKFLNSDKLGVEYQNDIFVADYILGAVYHFEPNEERSGIVLDGPLRDKIANNFDELESVIFAPGFRAITDLELGEDGFLYVLTYVDGGVYRIVPRGTAAPCS